MRRRSHVYDGPARRGLSPAAPCANPKCGTIWGHYTLKSKQPPRLRGLCKSCYQTALMRIRLPHAPACHDCGTEKPGMRVPGHPFGIEGWICVPCYSVLNGIAKAARKIERSHPGQEAMAPHLVLTMGGPIEGSPGRLTRCRDLTPWGALVVLNPYVDPGEYWPTLLARLAYDRAWANIRKLAEAS